MKAILCLIISGALVVSGYSQTRNVLVGTNNSVVQPTNFWSADASNARTGLGLGSAATNPSSAFQPASTILSNLSAGNGLNLTNLASSNLVGVLTIERGGTGATNASGARNSLGLGSASVNSATDFQAASPVLSNLSLSNGSNLKNIQASNVVGVINISNIPTIQFSNLNGIVSIDQGGTGATNAANARTALGLGTAATNQSEAFQPSSVVLSNLSLSNGNSLTNIAASSIVGTVATASNITGTAALATNVTGVVALVNGGTGATNATGARTALGISASDVFVGLTNLGTGSGLGFSSSPYILGSTNSTAPNNAVLALDAAGVRSVAGLTLAALTNTDNAAFRAAIGLGTAATNSASAFQPASTVLSNLASSNGGLLTNITAANIIGAVAISNGGSGATTAGEARTNFGLGWSALTNSNAATSLLGLNSNGVVAATNRLTFSNDLRLGVGKFLDFGTNMARIWGNSSGSLFFDVGPAAGGLNVGALSVQTNQILVQWPINFGSGSEGGTRTNLGLGWPALTNTTASGFQADLFGAGTNPVLVNTNGEVVSPTNFWQEAPITTTFIESQPATNSSTNISPSRLLHIHSLATNIVNTTNTIILPTNALTFEGDMALVVHKGPTNSLTQVRQAGSTNNIITLNKFNEAVEFTYYNDNWQFLETAAFTDPIYFSGTNTTINAGISRTNLGLGATNNVEFGSVAIPSANLGSFTNAAIRFGTNNTGFYAGADSSGRVSLTHSGTRVWIADASTNIGFGLDVSITFQGTNAAANAATTRTNLGLGATWLTNTNVTNFRTAIGVPSTFGSGLGSVIAGGSNNTASAQGSAILGGTGNDATASESVVSGGYQNTASGIYSTVAGGFSGYASGNCSAIAGGQNNLASAEYSIVVGGVENRATAPNTFAAGSYAFATNAGSFVWSDNQGPNTFSSTNTNSFNVRASGGVRFVVGGGGISSDGDITINQSTASNGLLYIRRTNNEAFLGMANLMASNNTTVSNETLFRVGVAESLNKSAQFGFRATNTNGNGVAVFSVYGHNALMMIGPSDPNAGTNPIQATISSVNPNNKVMTLITTNTGAMQMHRPIEWDNTTNAAVTRTNLGLPLAALTNTDAAGFQRAIFSTNAAPTNTANVNGVGFNTAVAWMEVSIVTNNVTNSYRIPLFQ